MANESLSRNSTDRLLGGQMMEGIQYQGKTYIAEPDVRKLIDAALATNVEKNDRIAQLEKELATAVSERGAWVSVKDRLPKAYDSVLAISGDTLITAFIHPTGKWCRHDNVQAHWMPSHWQPLPPRPAERKDS